MMGFFLLEQDAANPAERSSSFRQSLFDARQNRFAQSFENNLLGQKRFEQVLSAQGIVEFFFDILLTPAETVHRRDASGRASQSRLETPGHAQPPDGLGSGESAAIQNPTPTRPVPWHIRSPTARHAQETSAGVRSGFFSLGWINMTAYFGGVPFRLQS